MSIKIKRALISVSDKAGILEFARELQQLGVEILSTGGTFKYLTDNGVKVNLGAHGQLQGMGAHWELWSLQQGGLSNLEALKIATIIPPAPGGLVKLSPCQ